MTKTIRALAALALVSASLAAIHPPALATTLKRMSVADLSRAAHTVVRARCVTSSTRWDAGEIWTFTTFDVGETWKGSAPAPDHSPSPRRPGWKFHVHSFRRSAIRAERRINSVSRAHLGPGFLDRQLDARHLPNRPQPHHRRGNRHPRHRRLPRLRSSVAQL